MSVSVPSLVPSNLHIAHAGGGSGGLRGGSNQSRSDHIGLPSYSLGIGIGTLGVYGTSNLSVLSRLICRLYFCSKHMAFQVFQENVH